MKRPSEVQAEDFHPRVCTGSPADISAQVLDMCILEGTFWPRKLIEFARQISLIRYEGMTFICKMLYQ